MILIDISILIAYLVTMVLIGIYMRNKAKQDKESYLLGGKKLPWYMLGLSDASDMFDSAPQKGLKNMAFGITLGLN